jgi:hypothetical protein
LDPKKKRLTLIVFMEPGEDEEFKRTGTFCCKREPFADGMMEFARKTKKIPYSDRFVSIAVLREGEAPCGSAVSIYGESPSGGKPVYAILKPTTKLLSDIATVGDDDIRQILTQLAKRSKATVPYESLLKRIDNLTDLTIKKKVIAMRKRTFSRGTHDYTEARLNRCLQISEVKSWHECD